MEDTIAGNAEAVAKAVEEIRCTQYAPTFYNDEQALRYVIKFAYITAVEQYLEIEELPSGKGIADVVYLPKRRSMLPAKANYAVRMYEKVGFKTVDENDEEYIMECEL